VYGAQVEFAFIKQSNFRELMMSKDRPRAVLAVLLALSFVTGAGSAGATDAPHSAHVGFGIDHTARARIATAQGQVSAVDAVDRLIRPVLNRLVAQPLPTRQPPQAPAPTPISGLRGLLAHGGLDAALSLLPSDGTDGRVVTSRRANRAAPYIRFSEDEQVFGFSFKIQPPPQAPEVASPRS
jgi:hypothetical protein